MLGQLHPQAQPQPQPQPQHLDHSSQIKRRVHPNKKQLGILEASFQVCRKPSSEMRQELCKTIGINSRSIQIWFQNRRAREKKLLAESFSKYSKSDRSVENKQLGAVDNDGHKLNVPFLPRLMVSAPLDQGSNDQNSAINSQSPSNTSSTDDTFTINASSLIIGTWSRLSTSTGDLAAKLQISDALLCWVIEDGGFNFIVQLPLRNLAFFHLGDVDDSISALTIEVNDVPRFSKEVKVSTNVPAASLSEIQTEPTPVFSSIFVPCDDFTEDRQASLSKKHVLQGPSPAIQQLYQLLLKNVPMTPETFSAMTASKLVPLQSSIYYTEPLTLSNTSPMSAFSSSSSNVFGLPPTPQTPLQLNTSRNSDVFCLSLPPPTPVDMLFNTSPTSALSDISSDAFRRTPSPPSQFENQGITSVYIDSLSTDFHLFKTSIDDRTFNHAYTSVFDKY